MRCRTKRVGDPRSVGDPRQLHKRVPMEFVECVLEQFNQHRIGETTACELLQLSRSQLYRLRKRWVDSRRRGEAFTLYARTDSVAHEYPAEEADFLREQLAYICEEAEHYRGQFNFALLAEEAHKRFGHPFHRNSIRRFAIREGYYQPPPAKQPKRYVRFEMARVGELYQHDTSIHRWIPALDRNIDLILTQDDHSRLIVGGLLLEKESSFAHLCVVRSSVERYGIPLAYYVDNHSMFRFMGRDGVHQSWRLDIDEADPQFKRALESLGIGVLYAPRAESKGKIEKRFDYFQRRLPFLCEKYHVQAIEAAQPILWELIDYYNEYRVHTETEEVPRQRWNRALDEGRVSLREAPDGMDWDYHFSIHDTRKIKRDGTISFDGRRYPVDRYLEREVTVCVLPGQKLMVYKGTEKLAEYPL